MTRQREPSPPQQKSPPQGGGGGCGADDPLVSTKVRVPYPTGVEVDTASGVHRKKAGIVRVEYPDDPELYGVARGLLFPHPRRCARTLGPCSQGQGESQPPPPQLRAKVTRRLTPCLNPKTNAPPNPKNKPPTNPEPQNNPTPNPILDPTQRL